MLSRFLLVSFLFLPSLFFGQIQLAEIANTEDDKIQMFIDWIIGENVLVEEVEYLGGDSSVGRFNQGLDKIGMGAGLIMSTGNVSFMQQPESLLASYEYNLLNSDSDVESIAEDQAYDPAIYKVRFRPMKNFIEIKYVFASEEYPDFVCSAFNANDVLGIIISGPGIDGPFENNGENIALVPDTDLPVAISNVNMGGPLCPPQNPEFYLDNESDTTMAYGAYLVPFYAFHKVIPMELYEMKIFVSDVGDALFDSAFFLEQESMRSYQGTTSVLDNDLISNVKIYPNPSRGGFSATFNNEFSGLYEIISTLGVKIKEGYINHSKSVSFELPEGMYYLRFIDKDSSRSLLERISVIR